MPKRERVLLFVKQCYNFESEDIIYPDHNLESMPYWNHWLHPIPHKSVILVIVFHTSSAAYE
jgi:hypothetical protein